MKISLLYTSARPHLILDVLEIWKERTNNWENVEVILVTDNSFDGHFQNMTSYVNSGRQDCVTGWNLAASKGSGDMFVQVSDDLTPPKNWDSKLVSIGRDLQYFSFQLPDERGFPECVFHPVISRTVYEHFGYLYPPDFKSMFCDNWLFIAHRHAGFLRRVTIERFWSHRHRTTHDIEIDEVLMRHESVERYAEGREILIRELAKLGISVTLPDDRELPDSPDS